MSASSHMEALVIDQLVKKYDAFTALGGVSLRIRSGEFFGLLGPNGAGKTTLIKTIVGLARPSSGSISVFGVDNQHDPITCKGMIGLSPQETNVDRYFTVKKILYFHAGYFGFSRPVIRERIDRVLEQCGLTDKMNASFYKLSGGMQRRLMIARSLITQPRLLILDEPTAGVDVEQRHDLWRLLQSLNRDGTTIILTTHYIDEAEALCERVAIIDKGNIQEIGSPRELIARHCRQSVVIRGRRFESLDANALAELGREGTIAPSEIVVKRGNLEQVFLKITGHSIHEDDNVAI